MKHAEIKRRLKHIYQEIYSALCGLDSLGEGGYGALIDGDAKLGDAWLKAFEAMVVVEREAARALWAVTAPTCPVCKGKVQSFKCRVCQGRGRLY